jgi:hypothetical protein
VSAILAPRLPSGFGCPVVLSRGLMFHLRIELGADQNEPVSQIPV